MKKWVFLPQKLEELSAELDSQFFLIKHVRAPNYLFENKQHWHIMLANYKFDSADKQKFTGIIITS